MKGRWVGGYVLLCLGRRCGRHRVVNTGDWWGVGVGNVRVGVGVGLDVRAYVHACVVATMMCCDVEYRSSALRISQGPIEVTTYVCRYRSMYVRRECERRAWMPASPELSLFRRTDQISGRHGREREGRGGALGRNCRTKRAADDHSLAQMAYIVGSGGYMCLHACTSFVCLALCRLRVEGRSVSQSVANR